MRRRPLPGIAVGFTLVELLVVISIIGVLMALTLPAIQATRETARTTQCANNIQQLATATMSYRSAMQQYPTGGWGQQWIGHPPYQSEKQPGGWIYQLLPYLEEAGLQNANSQDPTPLNGMLRRAGTALPFLHCPSRRQAVTLPIQSGLAFRGGVTASNLPMAGRTDYAACAGGRGAVCTIPDNNVPTANPSGSFISWFNNTTLTGAVRQRIALRDIDFRDGRGRTYLYGEKWLPTKQVETGTHPGDLYPALTGFGPSNIRTTDQALEPDGFQGTSTCGFGSPHPGGVNFAFVDGSVRMQDYGIALPVLQQLGHRDDSGPSNEGDYIK